MSATTKFVSDEEKNFDACQQNLEQIVINNGYSSNLINLKKSEEFVVSRNLRLHVRSSWPTLDTDTAGVVFYLHGYGSHSNRPTMPFLAEELKNNGFALVNVDFHGFGYSEGTRALINNPCDLEDDVFAVLTAVYHPLLLAGTGLAGEPRFKVNKHGWRDLPYFIMGLSLGGSVSLSVGNVLHRLKSLGDTNPSSDSSGSRAGQRQDHLRLIAREFSGVILLAPGIKVSSPNPIVRTILSWVVAPLIPEVCIPSWLSGQTPDEYGWRSESYIQYTRNDSSPLNPDALSFQGSLRFRTAVSMLNLFDKVTLSLKEVSFPFLVLHDPEDKITWASGSMQLYSDARTDASLKKIVAIEDGRHDLLANDLDNVLCIVRDWLLERVGHKVGEKFIDSS